MRKLSYISLTLFAALVILPGPTLADFYKYIDENGKLHITNNPKDPEYMWYMSEAHKRKPEPVKTEEVGRVKYSKRYDPIIHKAAARNGIDPALVKAVIKAESDFNTFAESRAGAKGLMQLMPETADLLGVIDIYDPEENVDAGVRHLRHLLNRFEWNVKLAVAAYNAGERAVQKYGRVPPYDETQTYVSKVLRFHEFFKSTARF